METLQNTHTVIRTGRRPLERPATRSTSRPNGQRPPVRHIHEVLVELAEARRRYEDLRVAMGSLDERAHLTSVLHELRAEAAHARTAVRRQ